MNELVAGLVLLFSAVDASVNTQMQALNSPKFVVRQRAFESLEKMGWASIKYVKAGLDSKNPEVAYRCRQLATIYYGTERVRTIVIDPKDGYFKAATRLETDGFSVVFCYFIGNNTYEFHLRRTQ